MHNLTKVLHDLQAVLREDGRELSIKKVSTDKVLLVATEGAKQISITATPTQLQQILNALDLWEAEKCVRE